MNVIVSWPYHFKDVHKSLHLTDTPEILSRDGSLTRGLKPIGVSGGRLSNWLLDSGPPLDKAQHDSAVIEKNINKLNQLLQQIEIFHITSAGAGGDSEVKYCIIYLFFMPT